MCLAMDTVMTMKPQPCSTWLSISTGTLFAVATSSQRSVSASAETHISLPAPKRSKSLSESSR